jgi:putative endonuclease
MIFSVYIVACADATLYTGVATDVARRVDEHNGVTPAGGRSKRGARYTAARRPVALVYKIEVGTRADAGRAEARLKKLSRLEKLKLIADGHASVAHGAEPGRDTGR